MKMKKQINRGIMVFVLIAFLIWMLLCAWIHNISNTDFEEVQFIEPISEVQSENEKVEEIQINEKEYKEHEVNFHECRTWRKAYTTSRVNIRSDPDIENNNVVEVLPFNSEIEISEFNDEWYLIDYGYVFCTYVKKEFISFDECPYQMFDISNVDTKGFKSYMDYSNITSKNSPQYKLQDIYAYTGDNGIRQVYNRYCVAIGTYFDADVGQFMDLILDNGTIIECVVGDAKADCDTSSNNITTRLNKCVSEFIVDTDVLNHDAKYSGDISKCYEDWDSRVVGIKLYDYNVLNR